MKMNRNGDGSAAPPTASQEIYDTEVHCGKCGMRLYVSPASATLLLASLECVGVAGLACLCGHTQFIDAVLRPIACIAQKRESS